MFSHLMENILTNMPCKYEGKLHHCQSYLQFASAKEKWAWAAVPLVHVGDSSGVGYIHLIHCLQRAEGRKV